MKQDTLEGKAKTKNGVKRLCFSIVCILLEVVFIITIVTRLNEYAEIINLFTRILSGILVLGLYASDKTSSMKMPWVILILIFPIMGVVEIKNDLIRTMGECRDVTDQYQTGRSAYLRLGQLFMRLFAGLL